MVPPSSSWWKPGVAPRRARRLAGGTTVLVATHGRELIRLVGRRTITLNAGHVVEVA